MTTPGGVPNLPHGALTLDTLASKLQDMSGTAMKNRAVERFPSIFNSSTGLDPSLDITPFGILTSIFAEVNSLVANADPADIQGPEDLPELVLEFIEGLPVIGQFVGLLEAILGTYTGDDEALLTVQEIFGPIRALVTLVPDLFGGLDLTDPGSWDPATIWSTVTEAFFDIPDLSTILGWFGLDPDGDESDLQGLLGSFLTGSSPLDAFNLFNLIPSNLISAVGLGALGERRDNLLTAGAFENAVSVQGSGIWFYDATTGRTTNGCVSVNANGSEQRLLSNAIPATEGDKIEHIIRAKWSGLTYTGTTPFRTRIVRLLNHTQVGIDNVGTITSPVATETAWQAVTGVDYTVPAGCDSFCYELTITAQATGGNVKFDDGELYKVGLLQIPWTEGLPDSIQGILDAGQETIDAIFEGITGFNRIGNLVSDVIDALQNIPSGNVGGRGGPANIGDTAQATWDQSVGGMVGAIGTGAGLADVYNISQQVSSWAALGRMGFDILGIRSNKSLNTGFLPTSESNFGFDKVALAASAPTFALTQSTAIMAFQRISEAASKGVVSWHGSGVASITNAYVNVYKMDTGTGGLTLVHASGDIIGNLSASMQQNIYSLPTPIDVLPTEVYGIEIAIRGAGTHNVVGQSTWMPDQTVYPRRYSAIRNSGTSAAPSTLTPTYTTNVPFIEFGVSAGDVAIPHQPQLITLNIAGTTTLPIPSWANTVQRIVLGGGGGGHQGGTWGVGGEGGDNATWATDILVRGTDFTGSPSLSVTVGAGGAAGVGGNGGNGGNSACSLPGPAHTITSTGGVGANSFDVVGSEHSGESPGNVTYDSVPYVGGAQQDTYGAAGAAPGGGGAGGNWVSFQPGGAGAAGVVFIRFKQ